MKQRELEFNGEIFKVRYEFIGGRLWVHTRGQTWDLGPAVKAARAGRGGGAGSSTGGDVRAPMPGKLVKVSVNPGDQVTAGQVVAVMEAMKMEYTLKSSGDGVVKSVKREAGGQVALDEVLIVIEKRS